MNTITLDPAQVRAFGERLVRSGRRRISLADIWTHFAASFPARPEGSGSREWLRAALEMLAEEKLLVMPAQKGKGWDAAGRPAIPRAVRLPPRRAKRGAAWKSFPWHRQLSWVASMQYLSEAQEQFLLRVHQGLVEGMFSEVVPLKHRSLQLTRGEKQLRHIMATNLFAPGRLSLELLGCEEESTPLAWERVGPNTRMIILENSGPYHLVRKVLESNGGEPYGLIAYGGGGGFRRSVGYLPSIRQTITELHYVGDIDRPGLAIVNCAALHAAQIGLPNIAAAPGVHLAMLQAADELGRSDGWKHKENVQFEPSALSFYPPEARQRIRQLLERSHRVPEEVLTSDRLQAVWKAVEPFSHTSRAHQP